MNRFLKMFLISILITSSIVSLFASGKQEKADDGVTTVTVLSTTILEKPEGEVEQMIADKFMAENPDIRIEFIGTKMNEAYSRITTLATAGDLPDIFINTPEFRAQAAEMGIVADMESLFGADYFDGLTEAAMEEARVDGVVQYIPWFQIPMGLFYRIDWLDELGMEPPKNWDEFVEVAKAMTKDLDKDGQMDQWGFSMVGTNNGSGQGRFIPYLRTWGAEELYMTSSGKYDTQLDSKESIAGFQFFGDLKNVHGVVPPGVTQNSYGENITLMASGKTGMMITGPHSIGAILAQNPDLADKLGSVPVPKGKEYFSTLSVHGHAISSASKNKEAAVKYIKYLMNAENQAYWTKITGRMPVSKKAAESPTVSGPAFAGFLDALDYCHALPSTPYYSEVKGITGRVYQELLLDGDADAEALLKEAAKEIRQVIKDNS